jgi:4-hydroxybenzoate polyprenyltransferase
METRINAKPHALWSWQFVHAYLITMRPYLLFVSGITGIAGSSFVHGLSPSKALFVGITSFLSYGFGQALTDCFQIDTDSLSAPYRPLTQGSISRNQVFLVSIVGLLFCVTVFAACNPLNLPLGLAAGIGLATYTPFKRIWISGPFYNAWIVVVLFVMGFLAGAGTAPRILPEGFMFTLLAVFFGYANFVLAGYFKDIAADNATGYRTLPVVYGRGLSCWVSDGFAAASICFAILSIAGMRPEWEPANFISMGFMAAAIAFAFIGQILLHKVRSDEEAHLPIACVVHSYILLLSAICTTQSPKWALPLLLFYAGFLVVLNYRPARDQI